jgi:hypothetical protein
VHVPVIPPVHVTCGAVHCCIAQHASPEPPHIPHAPFAHVPPMFGHALPVAVHTLRTQHPPDAHVFRSQHGCPAAPQTAHVPALHVFPELHCLPAQHVWPAAPHGTEPSSP